MRLLGQYRGTLAVAATLCLGVWVCSCSGPFGPYSYSEQCYWEYEGRTFSEPSVLGPPPPVPMVAGAPLRAGQNRLGLEINPAVRMPFGRRLTEHKYQNWASTTQVGINYYGAPSDYLELGAYARRALANPLQSLSGKADGHLPPDETYVDNFGLATKINLTPHGSAIHWSIIAEVGVRYQTASLSAVDRYQEICDVTCEYDRDWYHDSTRGTYDGATAFREGWLMIHDLVPDWSVAAQLAVPLSTEFFFFALCSLQNRTFSRTPLEWTMEGGRLTVPDLGMETFYIVHPALGLDLAFEVGFIKLFMSWPFVFAEEERYGLQFSTAFGAQF
jgi:hypothetical protein